jgi:valyl-tRNA synthetase
MADTKDKTKKKGYDFSEVEPKIMQLWEKEKIFKFNTSDTKKEIFSLDTPPPTVSGRLHMGHVFGDAQQDFIARYKRMKGFNVLNPFGTDNNGLPTLKLVEKEKKVRAKDMTREEFIELCQKTIEEEFIPEFLKDAKRLGISADWDIFYSTIDKRSRRISQKSFIDLYNAGKEYRTEAPSLWCTKCQTTIAQVELEDVNKDTTFNDIIFKVDGKDLVISTTRPELLPACVCIFVNPSDKKYKDIVGKKAKVPLFNFEVPIMTDERADPEKGSGAVMCCTFGDQTDMEWQKEYQLEIKEAITPNGKMNSLAGKYEGMKIEEARKEVIKDLENSKLLIKQEKINHDVNVHERCGTPIEFINSKQWFVKYLDIKEEMIKWGDKIDWHPKYMQHRYTNWVKGLKWDWCISRQIPFGIPFPVWYCKDCGEIIMAQEKDLPVDPLEDSPPVKQCPKCKSSEFIPEKDIMNTWATSSLTPDIIKDILKDTKIYDKIKDEPMSVRRNGHDIITFWDFNSILKSQLHHKRNPWNKLMINGWMMGKDGKKMAKSRGNGITPQDTIEQWGSDVLRYLCATSKLGEDLSFPEAELTTGKKTVTKLFNASKFVFMNLEDYKNKKPEFRLNTIDIIFLNKLNLLVESCTKFFDNYEYSKVKQELEKFFWNDFCDNYLEIVKKRIYNLDKTYEDCRVSAQYTLYKSLLIIIKLFAPIMPFVTEEIYQTYFKQNKTNKSIHILSWPEVEKQITDIPCHTDFDSFSKVLSRIRQEKTRAQKSMNSEIILTLEKDIVKNLGETLQDLQDVTNAKKIKEGEFEVEFI